MILVVTVTHVQPFDRLVRASEDLAMATGEEVFVQRGPSEVSTPHCRSAALLPHGELLALMARARIVITHGGPAAILEACSHGTPIVVPRDPRFHEHVDGHQISFARRLVEHVHVVEDPARLYLEVERHGEIIAGLRLLEPGAGVAASVAAFSREIGELLTSPQRPPGLLRATVAFFKKRGSDRR